MKSDPVFFSFLFLSAGSLKKVCKNSSKKGNTKTFIYFFWSRVSVSLPSPFPIWLYLVKSVECFRLKFQTPHLNLHHCQSKRVDRIGFLRVENRLECFHLKPVDEIHERDQFQVRWITNFLFLLLLAETAVSVKNKNKRNKQKTNKLTFLPSLTLNTRCQ